MRAHVQRGNFGHDLSIWLFTDDTHTKILRLVPDADIGGAVSAEDVVEGTYVEPTWRFAWPESDALVEAFKEFLGQEGVDLNKTVPKEIYEREAARVDKFINNLFDIPAPSTQMFVRED